MGEEENRRKRLVLSFVSSFGILNKVIFEKKVFIAFIFDISLKVRLFVVCSSVVRTVFQILLPKVSP